MYLYIRHFAEFHGVLWVSFLGHRFLMFVGVLRYFSLGRRLSICATHLRGFGIFRIPSFGSILFFLCCSFRLVRSRVFHQVSLVP